MKLLFILLLAPLFGWGQSQPDSGWANITASATQFRIDTVQVFKKPDTTHGYILVQTCQQCVPIYRPIISVKKSMWVQSENKVRYWRRQWVFGKIQYYYKPIPKSWKVIDYKRSEKW